jgi:hypothetical protein
MMKIRKPKMRSKVRAYKAPSVKAKLKPVKIKAHKLRP